MVRVEVKLLNDEIVAAVPHLLKVAIEDSDLAGIFCDRDLIVLVACRRHRPVPPSIGQDRVVDQHYFEVHQFVRAFHPNMDVSLASEDLCDSGPPHSLLFKLGAVAIDPPEPRVMLAEQAPPRCSSP
jgi:hypothetical protein